MSEVSATKEKVMKEEKRVFENGAFYPAIMPTGIDDIEVVFEYWMGRFHIGGIHFHEPNGERYSESNFSWIGEKLEIQWPVVD